LKIVWRHWISPIMGLECKVSLNGSVLTVIMTIEYAYAKFSILTFND
jgi:hypothetical protein